MARTTVEAVLGIMGRSSAGTVDVASFINSSNTLVTRVFTGDTTVTEELLTDIEKWYTAHLLASTIWKQVEEEKVGDATIKYAGKTGMKLEYTSYGQIVMQLDPTGKMESSINKRKWKIIAIKQFTS